MKEYSSKSGHPFFSVRSETTSFKTLSTNWRFGKQELKYCNWQKANGHVML